MADRDKLQKKVYDSGFEDFRIAARYERAITDIKALLAEIGLTQVSISKTTHPLEGKKQTKKDGFAKFL